MKDVVQFIFELEKLKGVTRKVKPVGLDRYENSAEHSWQIAMLATALHPYASSDVNLDRVIQMLLVHDVGEVDTGDTMLFVEERIDERKVAERAAIHRIFGGLADGRGTALIQLWEEFEAADTADARFAHAADRAMPVLLNLANCGQSWRENGISYERVVEKVSPPIEAGCPSLWSYLEQELELARSQGWFGAEPVTNAVGEPARA